MASSGINVQKNAFTATTTTKTTKTTLNAVKPKKKPGNQAVIIKRNPVNDDQNKVNENLLIHQVYELLSKLSQSLDEKYERYITPDGYRIVQKVTRDHMGFCLDRQTSLLKSGGIGVFVVQGEIKKHSLVAFYPGTVYRPGETVFLQSVGNKFVFRCSDGTFVDGNDRGLSKLIYRSCTFRDRLGPNLLNDMTWVTKCPANPLAIGQYVNNSTDEHLANVCYEEIDFPVKYLTMNIRRFVPNALYATTGNCDYLRLVVLISLRDIACGEELYSNYFTIVE